MTRRGTHPEPRSTSLHHTRNDIPAATRRKVVDLLNQRLADCIDLQAQCKQAHWNVQGPTFIALHKLFDEIHAETAAHVDLIAERVVQLGGSAEGTVQIVAGRTQLREYPLGLSTAAEHVSALSDALAAFARAARAGIDEVDELGDKTSGDILTEVSRGTDKSLWFVEAHQPEQLSRE
jgi:starvation-inducible DNA-binding protein